MLWMNVYIPTNTHNQLTLQPQQSKHTPTWAPFMSLQIEAERSLDSGLRPAGRATNHPESINIASSPPPCSMGRNFRQLKLDTARGPCDREGPAFLDKSHECNEKTIKRIQKYRVIVCTRQQKNFNWSIEHCIVRNT